MAWGQHGSDGVESEVSVDDGVEKDLVTKLVVKDLGN